VFKYVLIIPICGFLKVRNNIGLRCPEKVCCSQFLQHFTCNFFVQTLSWQLFSSYMYVEKFVRKMLVKLAYFATSSDYSHPILFIVFVCFKIMVIFNQQQTIIIQTNSYVSFWKYISISKESYKNHTKIK